MHNPIIDRTFTVQVKALRSPNYFLIRHSSVRKNDIYVFVLLNKPGVAVKYYVVPGAVLLGEPDRFERWFLDEKMPGIHSKTFDSMPEFLDAWHYFENPRLANAAVPQENPGATPSNTG